MLYGNLVLVKITLLSMVGIRGEARGQEVQLRWIEGGAVSLSPGLV